MHRAVRRRGAALAVALALAAVVAPARATAHPLSSSAILLDVADDTVTGEVQLPNDRLAVARKREITAAQAAGAQRTALERYAAEHIAALGTDGAPWAVKLGRSS